MNYYHSLRQDDYMKTVIGKEPCVQWWICEWTRRQKWKVYKGEGGRYPMYLPCTISQPSLDLNHTCDKSSFELLPWQWCHSCKDYNTVHVCETSKILESEKVLSLMDSSSYDPGVLWCKPNMFCMSNKHMFVAEGGHFLPLGPWPPEMTVKQDRRKSCSRLEAP